MKKENVIVSLIILTIVVGYFIFLTVSQMKKEENVFLSRKKVEFESLATPVEDKPIMRYQGREFKFSDLPVSIQQRIKNEQLASHKKIQLILKDFVVRFHKAVLLKKDVDKIEVEKLPPLVEIANDRVDETEVERIYKLNINRLPKDHDPVSIKQKIKLELLTNDAYKYVQQLLTDINKKTDARLPAAPEIPEEWLVSDNFTPTFGSPDAVNHLIWISDYACKDCDNYTTDLGLLVQKYSDKELRVTFIPWSENDIDIFAYLNLAAICLYKEVPKEDFWRYHTYAMTGNSELRKLAADDLKKAKEYLLKNLKESQIPENKIERVRQCAADVSEENALLVDLVRLKRKLQFIPEIRSPTLFLNGRLLDLEGITLFKAVDQELATIMKEAAK